MTLNGTIRNGVVVLDQSTSLPEGTRVKIFLETNQQVDQSIAESLLELAGQVDDLPSDMARNHDHYIHGAPRK